MRTLEGDRALVVGVLYDSELRLMEALRLRVKDLDFQRRELTVRNGKGGKDRVTLLPQSLVSGWGRVSRPYALARKYSKANSEWAWQWVLPSRIAGPT